MFRYFTLLIFMALFIGVSCSDDGGSAGSRKVVILTPDEVGEIVLPPGAFEEEVVVTLPPTTTQAAVDETTESKATKSKIKTEVEDTKSIPKKLFNPESFLSIIFASSASSKLILLIS